MEGVHSWAGAEWMYDLTIDDIHSFYVRVGPGSALVHNCARGVAERGLWSLTRGGSSAVMRGGPSRTTFFKSAADGNWWTRDLAGHGESAFKVYKEEADGLHWIKNATQFGDYTEGMWKGGTGRFIPWSQLSGA